MWIWLLAVIFVAAAWVARLVFGWIPEWVAVIVTIVAVLAIVARLAGSRLRALLRARALERDLIKQAQQQALNARPDRRGEIADLQVQMQRGLQALRQSPSGAAALSNLPWYMIIGPPGAGKTTALRQSGLAFPFLDPRSGGGVRGVGGTRNCDWWFTNDAILLDTAGRYATEADDYDEWTAFLDTLINGVLVAISVTDLMEISEDQIDTIAKRLRSRIDEVTARLHMLVPVYVMFTKIDLVAGFVELWGDLRKSERGQIWGVTFPLAGAAQREPGAAFEPEMDLLVEGTHARALRRVSGERDVQRRPRIVQFPLEFAALKPNLASFLSALLQPNNFRETPSLRGVYFTSGTQEGRPIDRVIGGMMAAFNLPSPGVGPAGTMVQTDSKSYFVTDLFKRVVFPDQHVAGRTQGAVKRQLANQLLFAAVSLLVAMCLVAPSTYTFARNMLFTSEARALAARARAIDWSDGNTPLPKVRALDDLRNEVVQLDGWHEQGVPLGMGWGMYTGDRLVEPLRGVYSQSLRAAFAQPTKAQLERELAPAAAQSHMSLDQYGAYFLRLKAYLSLADPQRLQGEDRHVETVALTEAWARALGVTSGPDKDTLAPHVAEYVKFVAHGQTPPWAVDASLVARVSAALKQTSPVDRDYSTLIREANDNTPTITRASIFRGTSFSQFVASRSNPEVIVHGAFTRSGWETYLRDGLDERSAKKLAQERWVLGESDQRGTQLQQRYFSEYIAAWAALLKDLDVHKPENDADVLRELSSLSETPWPQMLLLETLSENTRLQLSPDSTLAKAGQGLLDSVISGANNAVSNNQTLKLLPVDAGVLPQQPKRWVSAVEVAFSPMTTFGVPLDPLTAQGPTQLAHYVETVVAKLVAVLTDLKDSPVKPNAKYVADAYVNAERSTNELLDGKQTQFTRPLLAPLLLVPMQK
jgi:type VI secretion system protein ImpL